MEDLKIPRKDPPRPKRVKKFYMRARPMYDSYAHVVNAMGHTSSADKVARHANMLRQQLSMNFLQKQFVTHEKAGVMEEKLAKYLEKFGDLGIGSTKRSEAFEKILDDQLRFYELLYMDPSQYTVQEKLELLESANVYEEVSADIQRVMLAEEKARLEKSISEEEYKLARMDFQLTKRELEQLKS